MGERTIADLKMMQSLPLYAKVQMTKVRIRAWVNEYGEDGVYISFSGGKDSTVLLDIVRNECGYKNIPAVFVDVPTQYPELRDFAKTFNNVEIIRPKVSFMEVCEKYGFPLISKEVAENVEGGRKYLTKILENGESLDGRRQTADGRRQTADGRRQTADGSIIGSWAIADLLGIERRKKGQREKYKAIQTGTIPDDYFDKLPVRLQILFGKYKARVKGVKTNDYSKMYDKSRYLFFLDAPFDISSNCCKIMKKTPLHSFHHKTGRVPFTAQMADESRLRRSQWVIHGCNGFDLKIPTSNPMSFWTENDVLEYIVTHNLPICSVYGQVIEDYNAMGQIDGQISLIQPEKTIYKTTGCKRTGCMLCGFGCHMKDDNRFLQLKETHPKMYGLLDVCKNNGVTFREAIEWTNEHGDLNIRL